jgi:hypothetical protein
MLVEAQHGKESDMEKFLKELMMRWPMAKGSLAEVRKPCIRPNCRACRSGRKHPAFIFGFREKGRQRCMHVPRELAGALRKAIGNGRWLEEELSRMGRELIEEYRRNREKKSGGPSKRLA